MKFLSRAAVLAATDEELERRAWMLRYPGPNYWLEEAELAAIDAELERRSERQRKEAEGEDQ